MDRSSFAPIAKVEGERRYGVVTDHLGAPRALFDEAGQIAWKAQLDLYGVARTDVMRTGCPWRWPGQYEDEETGLYYNRFRYYDPDAGRYISQDPIGLAGGLSAYAYTGDPFAAVDPLGLSGCRFTPDQEALVGIAKDAERSGVSAAEADTLRQWAAEVGLPFRGPEAHPNRPFGKFPHIHLGPVDHIPVR
jgi:RHS repeat-associated protein